MAGLGPSSKVMASLRVLAVWRTVVPNSWELG